jgi:hypothetical protein
MYNNADHATFIAMINVFDDYMKKDVLHNLDMLINISTEGVGTNLYKVEKLDYSEFSNNHKSSL